MVSWDTPSQRCFIKTCDDERAGGEENHPIKISVDVNGSIYPSLIDRDLLFIYCYLKNHSCREFCLLSFAMK